MMRPTRTPPSKSQSSQAALVKHKSCNLLDFPSSRRATSRFVSATRRVQIATRSMITESKLVPFGLTKKFTNNIFVYIQNIFKIRSKIDFKFFVSSLNYKLNLKLWFWTRYPVCRVCSPTRRCGPRIARISSTVDCDATHNTMSPQNRLRQRSTVRILKHSMKKSWSTNLAQTVWTQTFPIIGHRRTS